MASANSDFNDRPLVVVTGGSGLLGSRLIARLLDDFRVISLDLDGDPESPVAVEFICTDLTSDTSVERAIRRIAETSGTEIASVVHLAAYYDFSGAPSPMYDQVTVEGTRRLLEALTAVELEQFVFSSTMLVHEPTEPGDPIDEDEPITRSWPYPDSKVDTESLIAERLASSPTRSVIVRLAGVYDEMGHSPPITNQIKRIHGRWPTSHFYPADPDRGQAFVHLDDAVDALVRIVGARKRLPDPTELLVGEPEAVGYGDLQDTIAEGLHGTGWRTFQIPAPLARAGAWLREKNPIGPDPFVKPWMVEHASDHYELDISRANELLGWEPTRRVELVVPEMVANLKAGPEDWYAENDMRPPHLART